MILSEKMFIVPSRHRIPSDHENVLFECLSIFMMAFYAAVNVQLKRRQSCSDLLRKCFVAMNMEAVGKS